MMATDAITREALKAHAATLVAIRADDPTWTPKAVLAALTKAADTISSDPELLIRASTRAALMDEDPGRVDKPSAIAKPGLHWDAAYGSPLNPDGTLAGSASDYRLCDNCGYSHSGPAPECCPPPEEDRITLTPEMIAAAKQLLAGHQHQAEDDVETTPTTGSYFEPDAFHPNPYSTDTVQPQGDLL